MADNTRFLFEDTPPYDRSLIAVATVMPILIMSPIFLLMAYSNPALTATEAILIVLVLLVVLTIAYGLGVPAHVVVTEKGIVVGHGRLLRIRIPSTSIVSTDLRPPPWWFSLYYLFAPAEWVHVRKSSGLLKWWYIPVTLGVKLKTTLDSFLSP
ncbi:MAG: hypothetical protein ACFFH0_10260 [Promethearchaeota archaeon]